MDNEQLAGRVAALEERAIADGKTIEWLQLAVRDLRRPGDRVELAAERDALRELIAEMSVASDAARMIREQGRVGEAQARAIDELAFLSQISAHTQMRATEIEMVRKRIEGISKVLIAAVDHV